MEETTPKDPIPDMRGLSKKRLLAFEAKLRAADEARVAARERKKRGESGRAAKGAGETAPGRRGAAKRKRARRRAGEGAAAPAEEGRIDWAFSEQTIEAYYDIVSRIITPRVMAQEARCAGNPAARPRDYHG
ncbi:hypothetical protein [Hyphococcus sp.]|jgi:hypothetical protein|uniref:hypothetical protein n=1 Tax=Hyphococcus sp. TaxID=2038636 RepID=UPI003D0FC81F